MVVATPHDSPRSLDVHELRQIRRAWRAIAWLRWRPLLDIAPSWGLRHADEQRAASRRTRPDRHDDYDHRQPNEHVVNRANELDLCGGHHHEHRL